MTSGTGVTLGISDYEAVNRTAACLTSEPAARTVSAVLGARPQSLPLTLRRPRAGVWVAPLAWALLVLAGHAVGQALYDADPLVRIGAPPLVGSFDVRIGPGLLLPVALAVIALAWAPAAARRLRWSRLLAACWAGAGAWAVALAAADGAGALTAPLRTRYEYLAAVPLVGDLGRFVDGFATALASYPTHVKGHPPGLVTVLWGLDRSGLGGAEAATVLVLAVGAIAAPAALVALRAAASEAHARRAAPFVVFTPAAVWTATSPDALFAGVAAAGIACFAVAAHRSAVRSVLLGGAAGVILGAGLMLSYGIAALAVIVLAVALARRAWPALAAATGGVLAVLLGFAAAGFWWLDGLQATQALYVTGVAARRPYLEFVVIDLAAFSLAVGPAALAALGRLRDRAVWLLAGPALAAVALAALSGLSKGEVERIWLPFAPWLLVATAVLQPARVWLGAQLALALALQVGLRSPW